MEDIILALQELWNLLQKIILMSPDVITDRDNFTCKLDIVESGPIPGGVGEKFLFFRNFNWNVTSENDDEESHMNDKKRNRHQYITTGRRLWSAVRVEAVTSFINVIIIRRNAEEDNAVSSMYSLRTALTPTPFRKNWLMYFFHWLNRFSADAKIEYTLRLYDNWPSIKQVPDIEVKDYCMKYSNKL
jgi:hypothetical protein